MGRYDDRPPQGGRAFITHTPSLTIITCRWGCPGAVVVSNSTTTTIYAIYAIAEAERSGGYR